MSIEDLRMTSEEAHCLALIVNEFITNACKYGSPLGHETIALSLASADGMTLLEIRDQGPGFDPDAISRSSGLALVRALCRQLGASLEVVRDGGTRCRVRFHSLQAAPNAQDGAPA